MKRLRSVHVVPGWKVLRRGRTMSRHRTQVTATRQGVRVARRLHVELVVHGTDGRIRSKNSYGVESAARDREH